MNPRTTLSAGETRLSLAIIGCLFFIFGFVTWLNGTLIPFLRIACDLRTDGEALLVTFAFYMAYFFLALPASAVLQKTGFKRGMSLGLLIMAVGAALFLPAAYARSFPLFLSGLFVEGMGLALLQTASNPYISVVGPIESAAKRISIMGICNKVAGALSPLILGAIVLQEPGELERQLSAISEPAMREAFLDTVAQRVVAPYGVMALVLGGLAALVRFSPLPEIEAPSEKTVIGATADRSSVFAYPHLLLGVVCIFVYVGVEVMAGDVIGTYAASLGLGLAETRSLTSLTLAAMVLGYAAGIATIPRWLRQETALVLSALLGVVLSLGVFVLPGRGSVACIALLGLANALMWPAIFPLAIDGLGRHTKTGSALLIMGIAGGALIPQLYAGLAGRLGAPLAFLVCTLPCYGFIAYYAVRGHRCGRTPVYP